MAADIFFLSGILVIAFLYSGVGHGGASGYLALMAISGYLPDTIRPSALVLNLFVSGIAAYAFYKNGHLKFNLLWPFILTSIPLAFVGGSIDIDPKLYKTILGIFLLIAILRMLFKPASSTELKEVKIWLALSIGAFLGFLSGLIGIGGGIILSPLIILLAWGNQKETAAVSAIFIFVNSSAGLSGYLLNNSINNHFIILMVVFAVIGGILGSYFGSFKLNEKYMRYALAFVLVVASFKLILI